MVDSREGDRELVVGVADIREVRVYAPHDLWGEMDVDVALGALVLTFTGLVSQAVNEPASQRDIALELAGRLVRAAGEGLGLEITAEQALIREAGRERGGDGATPPWASPSGSDAPRGRWPGS